MTRKFLVFCLILTVLFLSGITPMASLAKGETNSEQSLKELSFLQGTWRGKSESGANVEEYWSKEDGDSMVGHCRFIKNGTTTFYELLAIVRTPEGIALKMRHFDRNFIGWKDSEEAGDCRLTKISPNEAVFDNNRGAHRVQVIYRRSGSRQLSTVVKDTRDGKTSTFPFEYHLAQ